MSAFQLLDVQVPTSTVLGTDPLNPYLVWAIQHQLTKHNGRLTFPGGKCTGGVSHLQCAENEWDEEVGGKGSKVVALDLFATRTDPNADVRRVTWKKATDGHCPADRATELVTAHYGSPDLIYTGIVTGVPTPKDGEARACVLVDVRSLRPTRDEEDSTFGAQHDLIAMVYRLVLDGLAKVEDFNWGDLNAMRLQLLVLFADLGL